MSCAPTLAAVVSRSRLPARALGRTFATLGLDVEDAREAVRIYLTIWRDVNAADAAAVAYLAALRFSRLCDFKKQISSGSPIFPK